MSRKPPLPGLDEAALATLASQFPSINLPPPEEPPARRAAPAPAAAAPVAVAPAKPPGRGLAVIAILLALLAIVATAASLAPRSRAVLLAALGENPRVAERAPPPSVAPPPAALSQASAAALEREIAETSAKFAASARETRVSLRAGEAARHGDEARLVSLEGRFEKFDGDLQALQTRLAEAERQIGTTLLARLGAVETKLGGLREADRRREKFFLAASQLNETLHGSRPFVRELAAVTALAGKDPAVRAALDDLQKHARDGVATVAELRDNFTGSIAPRLIALSEAGRPGFAARAAAWLRSWYAAGPAGDASAERNAAIVVSAERSLDRGQLAAAVDQVLLLEDQAALVTAGWLANASARLAADKAASALMRQALDRIARAD